MIGELAIKRQIDLVNLLPHFWRLDGSEPGGKVRGSDAVCHLALEGRPKRTHPPPSNSFPSAGTLQRFNLNDTYAM